MIDKTTQIPAQYTLDVSREKLKAAMIELARDAHNVRSEKTNIYRDRATGSIAVLALDDLSFGTTVGGMQLRGASELGLNSEDEIIEYARLSARNGSWKCWLSGLSISGGKLVIVVPDELLKDPNKSQERLLLMEKIGSEFSNYNYFARADMNITNELLTAYKQGGGLGAASFSMQDSAKNTASSVVGGLNQILKWKKGSELGSATAIIDGANGRIGSEIAKILLQNVSHLWIVERELTDNDLIKIGLNRKNFGEVAPHAAFSGDLERPLVQLIKPKHALRIKADIYCSAGPPGCFGEKEVREVQSLVIGGPANDLLRDPSLYFLRGDPEQDLTPIFVPGAALTAASMSHPQKGAKDLSNVIHSSARIASEVLSYWKMCGGEISMYEAMMGAAEIARGNSSSRDGEGDSRNRLLTTDLSDFKFAPIER